MAIDSKTLKRLDELAAYNERLEKKVIALQAAFVCALVWTGQTAGSPLGQADIKNILDRLK